MQYADPVLQRFFDSLGNKPFYMKQKQSRCSIANREIAVRHRYIQLNQRRHAYIVLDIDHERGAQAIEDAGLPVPTMIIHKHGADPSDPKPNSVHVYYELTAPVSDGPARNHCGSSKQSQGNWQSCYALTWPIEASSPRTRYHPNGP